MRFLILPLLCICFIGVRAQHASRLKVFLTPETEHLLLEAGFELDHGKVKPGVFIISDFTATERLFLDGHDIRYVVMIEDVQSFYKNRPSAVDGRSLRANCMGEVSDYPVPAHFSLGSMGGFFTYEEFLAHVDTMAAKFPGLITAKQPIDTFHSMEGRPLYWLRISDNATADEAEPEVLYTAVHHAREPVSLSQLIFFMYYLLENYGTNEEVTHLVDNTEMYFVPLVNPDGYVHNQITDPNGGGLWRKNRRNNGNGSFGIDINRNYGEFWGFDNAGSSPNPSSETYRGTGPFSEPETQAVKWLCEHHDFQLALNYHAFGNYVIYPWGHTASPLTPDSVEFMSFAESLTSENSYTFGTGYETVGYPTNGDSDDWMYGEQTTKGKIFSMTPEIGSAGDGFWPAQNRIVPICKENVRPNLLLAHFAGNYGEVSDASDAILSSQSGHIKFNYHRLGLQNNAPPTISLEAVSANVSSVGNPIVPTGVSLAGIHLDSISYTLSPTTATGEAVEFKLKVDHGTFSHEITLNKIFGQPVVLALDNADNLNAWETTSWATTTEDFYSPSMSITDSPFSNYPNNQVQVLGFDTILDLTGLHTAMLQFHAKWDIEAGFDYCQLQASADNGVSWEPLCGLYTKTGNSDQDEGQPVWDGVQENWIQEQIDLDDYLGQKIKVRFRLVSDPFVTGDGFYVDDFQLMGIQDSTQFSMGENAAGESWVSVFPNPASDKVFINLWSPDKGWLEVVGTDGKPVLRQGLLSGTTNKVDVSDLAQGLYHYRVVAGTKMQSGKFVLVR